VRYAIEDKPWGHVDVIHETRACGIYRLRIAPGATIPAHEHRATDEAELVVGSGLLLQGRPVLPGTAHRWPRGTSHRYDNPSATEQTVICVDRPAFDPADERETGAEAPLTLIDGESYYPPGAQQ
jgi:dihydroneopterin aldolase